MQFTFYIENRFAKKLKKEVITRRLTPQEQPFIKRETKK